MFHSWAESLSGFCLQTGPPGMFHDYVGSWLGSIGFVQQLGKVTIYDPLVSSTTGQIPRLSKITVHAPCLCGARDYT